MIHAPVSTKTKPSGTPRSLRAAAPGLDHPSVNAPGDAFEREADVAADAVMRTADPKRIHPTVVAVQRRCAGGTPGAGALDVGSAVGAARQGGAPLSTEARAYFEPRFGHDFSRVRVHTGGPASVGARAIQARAYTLGHDVVFGAGQYAPNTPEGRHLLAHELTHVIQQGGTRENIQRSLIYGSGYARPYTSDPPEIRDTIASKWFPSSVDMKSTADLNGGGTAAATFSAFLSTVSSQSVRTIKELGIIGHSNASNFGLGGTIKPGNNVFFDSAAVISQQSLTDNAATVARLKDRFAPDAKIILYGCDAGSGTSLMDTISQSFGVCVHGFKGPLSWCLTWNGEKTKILSRGNIAYADPNDPLAQMGVGSATRHSALSAVQPDSKSCVGVAPAAPASAKP